MVTFTLPAQFRALAWGHQRAMYDLITRSAWETVNTFSQNDRKPRGATGAVTVLHTHSRRLDYHPHVHLVMPGAAFDKKQRRWRNKEGGYLFDHKALPPPQPRPAIRCKCCGGTMKITRTRIETFTTRLRTSGSNRETVM